MSLDLYKQVAFALVVGLGMLGPAIAIGMIGGAATSAVGRNPQAEAKIRTIMILGIVFAESLAIFALVSGFIINFV